MSTDCLLDTLGNVEITVTRFSTGKLIGGKLKASAKPTFKVTASVQPINGKEREFLAEGWRQSYVVKLYTKEKLLTSDDKKAQKADLLSIQGESFEVISVERNVGLGMDHYKVQAARRND
jgi:hypothetical protein